MKLYQISKLTPLNDFFLAILLFMNLILFQYYIKIVQHIRHNEKTIIKYLIMSTAIVLISHTVDIIQYI